MMHIYETSINSQLKNNSDNDNKKYSNISSRITLEAIYRIHI